MTGEGWALSNRIASHCFGMASTNDSRTSSAWMESARSPRDTFARLLDQQTHRPTSQIATGDLPLTPRALCENNKYERRPGGWARSIAVTKSHA